MFLMSITYSCLNLQRWSNSFPSLYWLVYWISQFVDWLNSMIIVINGHIPNNVCFMVLFENPMAYLVVLFFPTNCLPWPFVCVQNFQTPISCPFDDHLCICGYFPPTNIDSFFVFIAMLVSWVCLLPKVGRPQQGSPGCLGTR